MNFDLFNQPADDKNALGRPMTINNMYEHHVVKGLKYIPNFLSKEEQQKLWMNINKEVWLNDLKRRVQHYGWKYDYKLRSINYSMYLGNLPNWTEAIAARLFEKNYMPGLPDQMIVNEYMPGQGIAPHIDCEPCFANTVISISLGSSLLMEFINVLTKQRVDVLLEPGSLVVIADEARYKWTHGISAR